MKPKTPSVAIIGAGPAGMYCALQLKELCENIKVDVYEKSVPLKTLLATGGGRCNLTHFGDDIRAFSANYPRGEKFLYSIFSKHFVNDTLDFFNKIGVETYMQKDFRYFPKSNSAKDMRNKMLAAAKKKHIYIIGKNICDLNELKNYDFIVISTGSKGGYNLAEQIRHTIINPKPALCGLKLSSDSPKYPQGVVLNTPEGEILFTKDGISGPYVYKISSLNAQKDFPYSFCVPLINTDELTKALKANPKKSFGNIVSTFIPKSLAHVLVKDFDKQCANVGKKEIQNLETLEFKVVSTDGKGEIVTSGGICLKEINSKCQSKLDSKIFFCGEIMNIDGFCGGFNLQNCWSSAYCVALGISENLLSDT